MYGSCKSDSQIEYKILLNIHSIEKGLAIGNRFFGEKKIKALLQDTFTLNKTPNNSWIYSLAVNTLDAYQKFLESSDYTSQSIYLELDKSISQLKQESIYNPCVNSGVMRYPSSHFDLINVEQYRNLVLSRRSVRDFSDEKVGVEEIKEAVNIANFSPSACNRQMTSIFIASTEAKKVLISKLKGISGFNTDAVSFAVITYDISAFDYEGERNQGYLNAGLFTMNLINALHCMSIGSCLLQWGNNRADTKLLKDIMNIPVQQNVVCVLAFGRYKRETYIPCSERKNVETILNF